MSMTKLFLGICKPLGMLIVLILLFILKTLWERELNEYIGGKPKYKDINPPKFSGAFQTNWKR